MSAAVSCSSRLFGKSQSHSLNYKTGGVKINIKVLPPEGPVKMSVMTDVHYTQVDYNVESHIGINHFAISNFSE